MNSNKIVRMIRDGNRMVVDPTTRHVVEVIQPSLTYTAREMIYGPDRQYKGPIEEYDQECFYYDIKKRLMTSWGFYHRVGELLKKGGYIPQVVDVSPPEHPERFEPAWDRVFDPNFPVVFRPRQDAAARAVRRPHRVRQGDDHQSGRTPVSPPAD